MSNREYWTEDEWREADIDSAMFSSAFDAKQRIKEPRNLDVNSLVDALAGLGSALEAPVGRREWMPEQARLIDEMNLKADRLDSQFRGLLSSTYGERWRPHPREEGKYQVLPPGEEHTTLRQEHPKAGGLIDPNTGEHPDVLYRYEGPKGVEAMEETGEMRSTFGGSTNQPYIHAALYPARQFAEMDSRLFEIDTEGGMWRGKSNTEDLYAVSEKAIPKEAVRDVTDTYDGPFHDTSRWEDRQFPEFEPSTETRALYASSGDTAREIADWAEQGLISKAQMHSYAKRVY